MNLPPYLKPINILDANAEEQIKQAGELARAITAFDLVCSEHGIFAREIQEDNLEIEETRHREGKQCWHEIIIRNHKEVL